MTNNNQPRIVRNEATSEYFFREGCHITEWLNSENDEDVSIARARVKPGVTTRLHCLVDTTERYVILEGRGSVRVGDLPVTDVEPGDVVIIPPNQPQQIRNPCCEDLIFLAICSPRFRPEAYQDLEAEIQADR